MVMKSLKKFFVVSALSLALSIIGSVNVYAANDVDWGISWDNGQTGWAQIGEYLYTNSYFSDLTEAQNFAKSSYSQSPNSSLFNKGGSYSAKVVLEKSMFDNQNTFGYYTGSGAGKSMSQIFGETESGPTSFQPNAPFGFYFKTPQLNTWFSDENEHAASQSGSGKRQLLAYALPEKQTGVSEYLIAAEDLNAASLYGSDRDYNDMWMLISSTNVVPEPVSSTLFLLGSGGFAYFRGRKKRRESTKGIV